MSADILTEAETAYLQAVGERLKKPFRLDKDTGELSREREDYKARQSACHTLIHLGNATQYLDEALHDLRDLPIRDESEADEQLRLLWLRVREIFHGVQPPAP